MYHTRTRQFPLLYIRPPKLLVGFSNPQIVDQFIDHNDLPLCTFKQRYWLKANYYKTGAEPTASWDMSTERNSELMGAGLIVVFTPAERYLQPVVNIPLLHTDISKLATPDVGEMMSCVLCAGNCMKSWVTNSRMPIVVNSTCTGGTRAPRYTLIEVNGSVVASIHRAELVWAVSYGVWDRVLFCLRVHSGTNIDCRAYSRCATLSSASHCWYTQQT